MLSLVSEGNQMNNRTFTPDEDSYNWNERMAAYAIKAGDIEFAKKMEREFYRVGGEGDCYHEYAG